MTSRFLAPDTLAWSGLADEIGGITNQNLRALAMAKGLQIRVRGRVQGLGFRPFIWREASALSLAGDVRNDGEVVLIRVRVQWVNLLLKPHEMRCHP